jgi:hypothetical protein
MGLMALPSGPALDHPAAPLLLELATLGCMADVGEGWMMEMLEATIEKGSHPSASYGTERSKTAEGRDAREGGARLCPAGG